MAQAVRFKVTFRDEDLGVFDTNTITMSHALQLEDKTGMTVQELLTNVGRSSARGLQALVWFHLLRLGRPVELFQEFTFADFDIDPVEDETDPTEAVETTGDGQSPSKSAAGSTSRS